MAKRRQLPGSGDELRDPFRRWVIRGGVVLGVIGVTLGLIVGC